MWYSLNDAIGKILLIAAVGGGAIYGGYKVYSAPPLLKQSTDKSDPRNGKYTGEIIKQHERVLRDLQEDQSRRFKEATEYGRRFKESTKYGS
jgi:hypothetical protein